MTDKTFFAKVVSALRGAAFILNKPFDSSIIPVFFVHGVNIFSLDGKTI